MESVMNKFVIITMILLNTIVCSISGQISEVPMRDVITSIVPQEYFVERIGGDRVNVEALVQPGQSPHTYEPTPRQMTVLSNADLFFRIGAEFENSLVPKIRSLVPNLTIVDTRDGITFRMMDAHSHGENHSGHTHACCPHHGADSHDPHIWLSPALVARQAQTIRDALIAEDPDGKDIYDTNYKQFIEELDALDNEIRDLLSDLPSRQFMVYHPAWGYFADQYKLVQIAIEIDGKSPPARQLARTIDQAKAEGIRVVFVQPQFSTKAAETIAEAIGGVVVSIDPLEKDFFTNMRKTATAIKRGMTD
jgi:zinc transport system substrate-binding protein